jgi:hypothetical protein
MPIMEQTTPAESGVALGRAQTWTANQTFSSTADFLFSPVAPGTVTWAGDAERYVSWENDAVATYDALRLRGASGLVARFVQDARLHIWDTTAYGSEPPPNPADGDTFAFALYGDMYGGDVNTFSENTPGVQRSAGTATAGTAGLTLIDSAADFVTAGVVAGDIVQSRTSGAYGRVVTRDSATQLTLAASTNLAGRVLSFSVGNSYRVRAPGNNPGFVLGRRWGAEMRTVQAVTVLSHIQGPFDNFGGAQIVLYNDVNGGGGDAGSLVLSAFGQGGAGSNEIRLATRSAADTLATRVIVSSGAMAFQEATTISVTTGILALDGASTSAIRLNEAGINVDTAIESENVTTLFIVDATLDVVSIGGGVGLGGALLSLQFGAQARTFATSRGTTINHVADTQTDNGGARTMAVVAAQFFGIPTWTNAANAVTATIGATVYISGAPVAGTNWTNTAPGPYALYVADGSSRFQGNVSLFSTLTAGADGVGASGEQLTSGGAGAEVSWTAAASLREYKQFTGEYLRPQDALDLILGTAVPLWTYKPGRGTGDHQKIYAGPVAEEALWAMHHGGRILDPISTFGYTIAAFQAMQAEIDQLKTELAGLRR